MKKILALFLFALICSSCDSGTYEELEEPTVIDGPVTYANTAKAIVDANCIRCHSAGGAASFRPLTTYLEVKDAVQNTNLLDRIQRQNGEPGQMPQTGRMPQDNINLLLQWRADGLLEN
ncbi:hypothetical protein D3C87_70880 [compost metagenome]|jgi:hypothetical protein|uniref:Cytochrome c domain-containing protein n=1 Tax=Flavobacterium endophyticum TaxID=1540163 RepID=A0A495LZP2_9FLAO|nr:cytochrome c [Flavobacterium endophyticum]RKS19091.1 hypothetical protein CLV94_3042 [Flavobacterium endophyticum]